MSGNEVRGNKGRKSSGNKGWEVERNESRSNRGNGRKKGWGKKGNKKLKVHLGVGT